GRFAAVGFVGTNGSLTHLGTISTVSVLRLLSTLRFVSALRTVGPGTLVVVHVLDRATLVSLARSLLTSATRTRTRRRGDRLGLLVASRRFTSVGLGRTGLGFRHVVISLRLVTFGRRLAVV